MTDWNEDVDADWGAVPDTDDQGSVDMDIDPSAFPEADDGKWDDVATDPSGWDDDTKVDEPTKPPSLSKQDSYFVMNVDTLEKRAHRLVKQTAEMLFVTEEEASCMLRHYGWKSQQLQTDWFNDSDKVRQKCGVSARRVITLPAVVPCQSAYCDEVASDRGTALNCGHFFCDDCWQGYLVSNVSSGRSCIFTRCMGIKCTKPGCTHKFGCTCDEMVPDHMFSKYLTPELLEKYKRWVMASFVEGEKKVKWCPNPKCSHTVEYVPGGPKPVHCVCGYFFCFACLQQAHVPAPCDLVKKWLEREQSDDATAVWLAARTKACPKCEVRIEKNKACNHMKCIKCGHDFCWLCKGDWKDHGSGTGGYYQCNKYDEAVSKGSLTSEEKTIQDNQRLLQKYRFYYNRFKGSQESIALTMKLGEKLDKLVEADTNKSGYISDAIAKLIDARRVLQWTYSMAYYLKAGKEKSLFEYQQELLIHQTEMLQELMDNTDPEMLPARRKEIIDRTGTMENFRRQMVAEVESGKFEVLLLNNADAVTNMWGCTACKCDNKPDQEFCVGCSACRTHGEQECKACRKKVK